MEKAGGSAFAARAGVAAIVAKDAADAAAKAARIAGLMPSNNLAGPAVFDFAAPSSALNLAKYDPKAAAAALADADKRDRTVRRGYGKAVYTALATAGGTTVGIVATGAGSMNHHCAGKGGPVHPAVRCLQHPGPDHREHHRLCPQRRRRHGGRYPAGGPSGGRLRRSHHGEGGGAGRRGGRPCLHGLCGVGRTGAWRWKAAPLRRWRRKRRSASCINDEIDASDNIQEATKAKAAELPRKGGRRQRCGGRRRGRCGCQTGGSAHGCCAGAGHAGQQAGCAPGEEARQHHPVKNLFVFDIRRTFHETILP